MNFKKEIRIENCNLKGIDPDEYFSSLNQQQEAQEIILDQNKSKDYSNNPKSTLNRYGK